jgi:hypothetical protein
MMAKQHCGPRGEIAKATHTLTVIVLALPHKRIAMLETNVEEYFFQFCSKSFDDSSTPFFFFA